MAPINESPIPHELQMLIQLGKEKKLWSIEIIYNIAGEGATKRMLKRNMTARELMVFRESMFKYGFKVQIDPGHWKIICPMDIVEVDLYQQDHYFFDGPAGLLK